MIRKYIPLLLTLFRLIASPLLLPALLVYCMPLNNLLINIALGSLFALLSITDFLDGYFARRFDAITALGRILDPIADKILILSALISLVAVGKMFFLWAVLFIAREFFVMGLRLLAAEYVVDIPVSLAAKCKTTAQMLFVTLVIINPNVDTTTANVGFTTALDSAQSIALGVALFLTLYSAYRYYRSFYIRLTHVRASAVPPKREITT